MHVHINANQLNRVIVSGGEGLNNEYYLHVCYLYTMHILLHAKMQRL